MSSVGIELAREHIESILGIEVPVGSGRTEPMVLCGLNKVAKKRRMWVSLEMIERVVPEMYVRYMRRDTSYSVRKGGYPTPPKVGHEEAHIISKFHKYTVRRRIELEALKSTNKENVCGPATYQSLGEENEELQTGEENEEMNTPSTLARMTPEDAMAGGEEMAGGEGMAGGEEVAGVVGDSVRVEEESLLCNDEEMPCTPLADEEGRKVRMFG